MDADAKESNIDGVAIEMNSRDAIETDGAKEKEKTAGWFEVFRFATTHDRILCLTGTLCALAHGAVMPLLCWIFGEIIEKFISPDENCSSNGSSDKSSSLTDEQADAINDLCVVFAIIGAGSFVVSFVQSFFWSMAAENQINTIRKAYFRSLLRQDVGWYDQQEIGALTSKFVEDMGHINSGIGDKIGLFVQNLGAFIGCICVGMYYGWELCLVTIALSPVNLLSSYLMVKVAFSQSNKEAEAYAKAGGIAQQVLSSIRTVTAFGRQRDEVQRYASNLVGAKKAGIRSSILTGFVMGGMYFFMIGAYVLGFCFAVFLIDEIGPPRYTIGRAVVVVWAVIEGTYAFGTSLSSIQAYSSSRFAAYRVFKIIDRVPPIDPFALGGTECDAKSFVGNISFKNVSFSYPTRPDIPILRDLTLDIEQGSTVAFVGPSGCGKSTVVQLIQRYYDVDEGQVLIDGKDIRDYNVGSYRSMIGSVSQEPILFGASIRENIRYGFLDVSAQDIENTAKMANAHDFIINKLPSGYDTLVGEQGTHLSGGQKQRVAIARALVRNPRIILLDEATSALDSESESIVQDALERAQAGRTTVAIAHRLSTIMNSDKIIVIDKGKVNEMGTHAELMANGGIYSKLVEAQLGDGGNVETDVSVIKNRRTALARKAVKLEETEERSEASGVRTRRMTISERKKLDADIVKKHYSTRRLWTLASKEIPFYLIGCIGAVICGTVWPTFAIIIAHILDAFSQCEADKRYSEGIKFSLLLLAIAFANFLGFVVMFSMFGYAGERVVLRTRKLAFSAMLRQEIAWFDDLGNSPGALTSRLSIQAANVKDATGAQLGQIIQIVAGLVAAFVISFVHDWRISLILVVFAPLGIMCGIIQALVFGDQAEQDKFVERASMILTSSASNIRTVASLGIYDLFLSFFVEPLEKRRKKQLIKILIIGVAFGLVETVYLHSFAAAFYGASHFIRWGVSDFGGVFTAHIAIMFSSYFVGQANAMAPNIAKAHLGVAEVFKLLDRKPEIEWDEKDENGKKTLENCQGNANFRNVEFHYPSRKTHQVLQGLNLGVTSGQTVALVGGSGCGKSTAIQLIERFYDPNGGEVEMDDNDLKTLSLPWVRHQMALVQQEPILFDRTIAENIGYGAVEKALQTDIEEAAKMANIHNFVASLPEGYNTRVGEKGSQLSGGQKQRIAIARALIRKPRVLLLDEATSALDSESEKTVQEALDKARSGRTVLVVAHRLSTVEGADAIAVLQSGVVCELGKHDDLLAKKGIYYGLWSAQQLSAANEDEASEQ